ncbi:MAG: N-acetyltransferase [Gemmatimonadota bacterium]|nr:MAG: N-acetyltransferase [Gemmatimonadota bacterium]
MQHDKPTYDVVHEPDQHRFAVHTEGHTAVLDYQRFPDKVVFTHTGVPRELEGRGIGSRLVRAGLDWARTEGVRVIPTCPFVSAYIGKHPEYADVTER